ncbi:hypothetical protein TVAG_409760 [Trichomonas vaginalis G3]|uniref:P-type ATPase C-terminal domain-containing protein n=1 Tax=Trichomonas vaginalis (strain ATCC PRA-98 / G3) TaxID=412133 RepID=A2F8D6_TRIV3|nr:phospholipid-translocating ATPase protein [Trichomonas vaginalis G3]EAX98838.1 hypothetical protein TVAG_409760 [Trichomonas vaginalis G3]KAI5532240.1 phospholipid-translocating ATPase protein [Trichomonas vaginalis G3]|eukprot:XP_001311768.1 hypothetical protein [Trichomonas vaginalis G3]
MFVNSIDKFSEIISCNSLLISRSMLLERRPILKRIFLNNQLFGDDISSRQLSHFIESETFTEENLNRHFADPALTVNEETNLFFEHISLCHSASIIIEKSKINYISRFHDDEELLKLAARSGVMLVKRTPEDSSLLQNDKIKHYKTMKLIHSCSKHPRITIIVDDGHEDDYLVLTRGIYKVMNFVVEDLQYYDKYYDQFHTEGFHVEVCAYKRLKKKKYDEFCNKIIELGVADTEFQFPIVEDYIEKNMTFLALLGFEDRSRKGSLLFLSHAKQHFDQICFATTSKGMSLIITIISLGLIDGNNPSIGQIKGSSQDDVDISLTYLFERQEYDCIIITGHSLEYIVTSEYADHAAELFKKTPVLIMQRSNYLQTAAFCEYQQKILKQRVLAVGHSVYDSCYMNVANLSVAIPANEIKPNNISSDIIVTNFEQFSSLIFVGSSWLSERIDSLLKFYESKNILLAMMQFCFSIKANINYSYAFSCSLYPVMLLFTVLSLFPHCITKNSKSSEEIMLDVTKPSQIYTKKTKFFFVFMFFTALAFLLIETIFFVIRRCSDPFTAVESPFLIIANSFAFYTAFLISDFEKFNVVNVPGVIGSLIFFFVFMLIYTNNPNVPNVFDSMFQTREEVFLVIFWFFVPLVFGYVTKYFSKPRISERSHNNRGFVMPQARNQRFL